MNLLKLIGLTLIVALAMGKPENMTVKPSLQKIIQISPPALDVLLHAFDNLVIYFHTKNQQSELEPIINDYEQLKQRIKAEFPEDHTLFGYINISSDHQNLLRRFGKKEGFLVLNRFIDPEHFEFRTQVTEILEKYQKTAHPKMPLGYQKQVLADSQFRYNVLFTFGNLTTLNEYNKLYAKIDYYLRELNVGVYAVPSQKQQQDSIKLFKFNKQIESYKFNNMTIQEQANELVQALNIDSLPLVVDVREDNLPRVFGGTISDQLILLTKPSIKQEKFDQINKIFEEAAKYNKQEQLAYERVIFCRITEQMYEEQFNEPVESVFSNGDLHADYAIMFTKTDYDRFNLKKYILQSTQKPLDSQDLIGFINDVRMKRLDPLYKSEPVPSQKQNRGPLRKIVGSTFISEVYEKQGQSTIVLFVDSKDEDSYRDIQATVEEFAIKYRDQFQDKLSFGIFDLDKNEHKLLYLKEAPQLVLFDKANKKQSKFFKIQNGVSIQSLEEWVNTEVSNASTQKVEALL